jgi:NADPH:quinone reductase-like Zn-dependent oxidoreductase
VAASGTLDLSPADFGPPSHALGASAFAADTGVCSNWWTRAGLGRTAAAICRTDRPARWAAAVQSVDAVQPRAGETVLVSGATGGVGAIAVQLVAARGARVIATARVGDETQFVRGLGAADVVDYTGDVPAQVRALSQGGVDAVLHFAGDGPALAELLVAGGRFVSTRGVGADQLGAKQVAATSIMSVPTSDVLERLATGVATGQLRLHIARTYRLEDAPQALADFGAPHVGKLAIAIA